MEIAIVGAGLTGCLLATILGRRGYSVSVHERLNDESEPSEDRKMSINLTISERGLNALSQAGLAHVLADAMPLRGRAIHTRSSQVRYQSYSARGDQALYSINRATLGRRLVEAAQSTPNVKVHFERRLTGFDPARGILTFGDLSVTADVVIGADGANSTVRGQLLDLGLVEETYNVLGYGYKELSIPAADSGFALDPGVLHVWPRGDALLVAQPNPDKSFTCAIFQPTSGAASFGAMRSAAAVNRYVSLQDPTLASLMPHLVDEYLAHPVGRLATVQCRPWQAYGKVLLVGDAAHAMVPFYGQGANCGFEDVIELDRCLTEAGGDWSRAISAYEAHRRIDCDTICALSLENFHALRTGLGSRFSAVKDRFSAKLRRALPWAFASTHELVSFSTVRYSLVRRRVRIRRTALLTVAGFCVLSVGTALLQLIAS